jgi:hypothetical protein
MHELQLFPPTDISNVLCSSCIAVLLPCTAVMTNLRETQMREVPIFQQTGTHTCWKRIAEVYALPNSSKRRLLICANDRAVLSHSTPTPLPL